MPQNIRSLLVLSASALMLSACGGGGGGGGGSSFVPPPPPPSGGGGGTSQPTFVSGQFAPSSDFKNLCASPRVGPDANGETWPDQQGTDLEERYWLRSWSDELYLWYSEITDTDPASYASKFEHFDALVTTRQTASGNNVDNFHFDTNTEDYRRESAGGSSAGYGWRYAIINNRTPRDVRIAFTFGGVDSADQLSRGATLLEVDGVDIVNDGTQAGVDVINAGLFPSAVGESHTFLVRDVDGTEREITVSAANVAPPTVLETTTFDIADGSGGTTKAGYINLDTFGVRTAERDLRDAFQQLENEGIEELFVDLRYNGGGFLDMSAQMAYMIAGSANTNGKTYYELGFNSKHQVRNPVTGETLSPTPFLNTTLGLDPTLPSGQALPALNLDKVSILSTDGTCSASEALINGLAGADIDVQLIGSTTCGKPYGFYPTDNCGTTYFTIQFSGNNDRGFGEYSDGFTPVQTGTSFEDQIEGCTIADDFSLELGDPSENMLEWAIAKRTTGTCPAASVAQSSAKPVAVLEGGPETAIGIGPRFDTRNAIENSLILGR